MREPGAKTLREIHAQPAAWRSVADVLPDVSAVGQAFAPAPDEVVFAGCGSSYYLALAAAAAFQRVTGIRSTAATGSEVVLFPELSLPSGRRLLLVAISRSGETSETVAAARAARTRGVRTLYLGCDALSTLARVCEHVLALPAGQEESVVMTRSFTTMLLGAQRAAGLLAGDAAYLGELAALPDVAADLSYVGPEVAALGADLGYDQLVYLGAGPTFGLAEEAGLKVKEMSLTSSIAYRPLEFRHGPISVVDQRTLAVVFVGDSAQEQEAALIRDLRGLGATVLAIAEKRAGLEADYYVELRSGLGEYARQVLCLPPCHLLAYHRAIAKRLDPDSPRNLTKVVKLDWS